MIAFIIMLANGKYETILIINIEDNDVNLTERRDLKYMQIGKWWVSGCLYKVASWILL